MTPDSKQNAMKIFLDLAEKDLWTNFERASAYKQRGDIGTVREKGLANFLTERLPGRFAVREGEVIDCYGNQTGQIDILIYDAQNTSPLAQEGSLVHLPAEALLAVIEVKSTLTRQEVQKCIGNLNKIYGLRPWAKPWGIRRKHGKDATDGVARVYTSIFAYKTDLSKENWAEKELKRYRDISYVENVSLEYINNILVLNKGMLLPAKGSGLEGGGSSAFNAWYFSLINFLSREAIRRKAFPWGDYEPTKTRAWIDIAGSDYSAPKLKPMSAAQKRRLRLR